MCFLAICMSSLKKEPLFKLKDIGKLKVKGWEKIHGTNNQWNAGEAILIYDKVSHFIILPKGKEKQSEMRKYLKI